MTGELKNAVATTSAAGWELSRSAYWRLHQLVGTESRLRRRPPTAGRVINLHRVGPRCDPYHSTISVAAFRDLLDLLSRQADVVGLAELNRRLGSGSARPAVVLSFDDGYQDFAKYAAPELAARRLTANQNVIPDCVDTGEPPWTTALACYLEAAPASRLARLDIPGLTVTPGITTVARQRYSAQVRLHLKRLSHCQRAPIWRHIVEQLHDVDPALPQMLSVEEVRQLSGSYEIGAHSFCHDTMEFETQQHFEDDLRRCQDWFARVLGTPMAAYAFPNDGYRDGQAATLRSQGITALAGDLPQPPPGLLPRLAIGGRSASEVRLRALGLGRRR